MINNLPFDCQTASINNYQIDRTNSNSYYVWKKLGSPQDPTAKQINEIKKNEDLRLVKIQNKVELKNNCIQFILNLPVQSVCLLKLIAN